MTFPQATALTCQETFSFLANGKGRAIKFREGQRFWVTNSQVDQQNRGRINVARASQKIGYDFLPEQINRYFTFHIVHRGDDLATRD